MSDIQDLWVATVQPLFIKSETEDVYQNIIALGQDMVQNEDASKWIQGDLASLVEKKYGRGMIEDLAKEIGAFPKTLSNRRTLCNFWEQETRWDLMDNYPNLKYSHFKLGMSYGKNKTDTHHDQLQEASKLLIEASNENWTMRETSRQIAARINKLSIYTKIDDMRCTARMNGDALSFIVTDGDAVLIEPSKEYRVVVYQINEVES